jgi:hypothetical protein
MNSNSLWQPEHSGSTAASQVRLASLLSDNLDWAAVVVWVAAFYSRVDQLCLALTIFAYVCVVCRPQLGLAACKPGMTSYRCSIPCRIPDTPVCSPPSRPEAPFRLNEFVERTPIALVKIGKGRSRTGHLSLSGKQDPGPVRSSKPVGIITRPALVRFHP